MNSVWLFVNRNNEYGDTIKAFSSKAAAKAYFFQYIGEYIYDCVKQNETKDLIDWMNGLKSYEHDEMSDLPYLCETRENGEEFYIEEVKIDDCTPG